MVAVPAGSGLLYWGCRLTVVVLMFLRSIPAPTNALITACWRSFVWFIAVVTSGAVNSMLTFAVTVSGTPCTCPEPMTVTWRGFAPGGWRIVFVACRQRDDDQTGSGEGNRSADERHVWTLS